LCKRFGDMETAKRIWIATVVAASFLAVISCAAFAQERCIIDDLGRRVCLSSPAQRIIALYGAFNEILASLGLEESIIARTKADKVPPSILSKPSIGTHMRPNVEMVFALQPDLVLQGGGRKAALEPVRQLMAHGVTVAFFNPVTFDGIFSTMERIGVLTGTEARAFATISKLRLRLEKVEERVKGRHRPKVIFEVRYPNLLSAGGKSLVDAIITAAGGENCFHHIEKKFVRPSLETLLECNPDIYVVQKGPMNRNPMPLENRPIFPNLKAVKDRKVLYVDERRYSRPTPNAVSAVEELSQALHPVEGE